MMKCVIWSDSSYPREYRVNTRSAMAAAKKFGRCENGEVVQIEAMTTGRVISRVQWTPEDGGTYVRVAV